MNVVNTKVRYKIKPFDLRGIELGPSRFHDQFNAARDYFMALPSEDMLLGFRRRAGLPHPGIELGGWYSNEASHTPDHDEIGNPFGQWISALSRMYATTGDTNILKKVQFLITEWGKTIEPDGYFFYSRDSSSYHYVYDKFVCGLVDAIIYCGFGPAEDYLDKITRWAIKNLVRYRLPAQYENWSGWNPFVGGQDEEWYTLGENLYRAYLVTGKPIFKDYAFEWHYDYFWDHLAAGHPEVMTDLHGYSHVNTLSSAAMAYQIYGEEKYLQTLIRGYDLLKRYQWMASGGYAPAERMANTQGSNGKAMETRADSFEVPCGTWAAFKISRYLMAFTGNASYAEWIETLLYNAISATLPIKDDSFRRGRAYYYADYRVTGGRKVYYPVSFPCCSGTYPQAVVEYFNLIYYYDENSLYVSQFIPSTAHVDFEGKNVVVRQETNYPESNFTTLTINTQVDTFFNLKLRIPGWSNSDQIIIEINEEQIKKVGNQDGWLVISRLWKTNERVKFTIPMALRFIPVAPAFPSRVALMYGPVMLAMISKDGGPLVGNIKAPQDWIKPVSGEPLHFRVENNIIERRFVPFFEIGERIKYYVYNDVIE